MGTQAGHPADVAAQIRALPPVVAPELVIHLHSLGEALRPETLVYVLRAFPADVDPAIARRAGELLVGRQVDGKLRGGFCERTIRYWARRFGFQEDDLDEFRQRCHLRMWRAIAAGAVAKPFWEYQFTYALRCVAIDEGRRMRREKARVLPLESAAPNPAEPDSIPGADGGEAAVFRTLASRELDDAIGRLPEQLRIAVWLRFRKDLPVESDDPDEPTVSGMMSISGSMVRRHLRKALQLLRSDPVLGGKIPDHLESQGLQHWGNLPSRVVEPEEL